MTARYLQVTYRKGKAVAAYLYLERGVGDKTAVTRESRPTVLVDFAADGHPIGIELTAPMQIDLATVNEVLRELGLVPLDDTEFAPIRAA